MKPKQSDFPSIYDEKKFKKSRLSYSWFYFWGILLIMLVVIRFINLGMWWFVTHKELTHKPAVKEMKYVSLHFSNYDKAKKKCLELSQKQSSATVNIVSYFNLLHPGVFLIHNKAKFSAVDLGRIVLPLKTGLFTIKMHLTDSIEKQWNQTKKQTSFGYSLLLNFFTIKESKAHQDVSYILKSLKETEYMDIPYLIYFYLPLVLILLLSNFYSQAVFTSFFYYTGLFILFDFKNLFFTVPFNWLTQLLKIKDTASIEAWAAVTVAVLFTILGFVGLFQWKKRRDLLKENLIVFFFILLPLFLRF